MFGFRSSGSRGMALVCLNASHAPLLRFAALGAAGNSRAVGVND